MKQAKTQKDRIVEYMKHFGEITQRDAIRLGCLRLSAQIFDLKKEGIGIWTELREVQNSDGTKSRIAVYSLLNPHEIHACTKCGRLIETEYSYCEEKCLCWYCSKMLQLKDERDGMDDE